VNPLPTAIETLPRPASETSVAIPAAFVIGCRSEGTITPGPSPMRVVRLGGPAKLRPDVGVERR
jgi:hypothetical protein